MLYTVLKQQAVAPGVYHLRLEGDTRAITRPGQFVQLRLPGFYLRRPISVCDWQSGETGTLDLIYKVVGHGTEAMTALAPGARLDVLPGLGNGFDADACPANALLVGGGVGTPPMYGLCKALVGLDKAPRVILGFNTAAEIFWQREFEALGVSVTVTTADGSAGMRGFVTAAMSEREAYVCACGPGPMLRAVYGACEHGQFSLEERMACGFGVCMGCSIQTASGPKRVCKDGPVFLKEDLLW